MSGKRSAAVRSKLKTLTYGAMHFCVAVAVTFALTGSLTAALSIGMIEPLVQTFAYGLHERLWRGSGRGLPAGYCHPI